MVTTTATGQHVHDPAVILRRKQELEDAILARAEQLGLSPWESSGVAVAALRLADQEWGGPPLYDFTDR